MPSLRLPPAAESTWALRAAKLRHLRLLAGPRRVGYVGWLGRENLGDEAVFAAYDRALGPGLADVPETGRMLARLQRASRRPLFRGAALGGGTLIGTAAARQALELMLERAPDLPLVMLGPGVEDPEWDAPYAPALADELRRWVPLLERFEEVTVRGPRSAAILAGLGIEAAVVGDPALLLGHDVRRAPPVVPRLGLNVGVARHVFGGDLRATVDALVHLGRRHTATGGDVRVLPVWPADEPLSRFCAEQIGPRASVFTCYRSLEGFLAEAAACSVLVGLKLHAVILAHAVGTPSAMVAYHPKGLDHQAAVASPWTARTDTVTPGGLEELVGALLDGQDAEAARLAAVVTDLRGGLDALSGRARAKLAAR